MAGHFIAEVEIRMWTAARICADLGTENVTLAEMQRFLRRSADGQDSNCYILYLDPVITISKSKAGGPFRDDITRCTG